MPDEVLDQTPDTEQLSGLPEDIAVDEAAVNGAPGTPENKEAETDDQKNDRVQREAAEAATRKQEKRRQSVDRRFAEITFEKKEAERRADEFAKQNARLLEAVLAGKGVGTATASTQGEPKPEQFTDYNDYVRAVAKYTAEQAAKSVAENSAKASQEAQTRQSVQQAEARQHTAYAERAREAAKSLPDFAEVMEDASNVDIPPNVLALIRKMPDGPVIAYHMVKNPQLAEQFFNTDDPEMHGILLGQISATIKGPAKVSNAPPPGQRIQAKPGSGTAAPEDPDAYMAWRAKNLR